MTIRLSTTARQAAATAIAAVVDGGPSFATLAIRSGTQVATPDTADTGTLLVTFTLTDPAFDSISSGVATVDTTPTISATAVATGTAGHFRIADSTGAAVIDGSVGTSSADLILTSTSIVSAGIVTLATGSITVPT